MLALSLWVHFSAFWFVFLNVRLNLLINPRLACSFLARIDVLLVSHEIFGEWILYSNLIFCNLVLLGKIADSDVCPGGKWMIDC